jgi:hypothetical protein
MEQAQGHPASFGFENVTASCKALRRCEGHLFWDDVHPTTDAHAPLADAKPDYARGLNDNFERRYAPSAVADASFTEPVTPKWRVGHWCNEG